MKPWRCIVKYSPTKQNPKFKLIFAYMATPQVEANLKSPENKIQPLIVGVQAHDLLQVRDERGMVARMVRNTDPWFSGFGEIYFSTIYPKAVKAWRKHTKMTVNYACIEGAVKIVLYDDRKNSKTYGEFNEFHLSPNNYKLLVLAPGIWSGFVGLGRKPSIIANCASIVHDDSEVERIPYNSNQIMYNW